MIIQSFLLATKSGAGWPSIPFCKDDGNPATVFGSLAESLHSATIQIVRDILFAGQEATRHPAGPLIRRTIMVMFSRLFFKSKLRAC
jgi:hypothetical protein